MDLYAHIVRFFQGGGAFMIPIAIVAALGLAIALERYIYLSIVSLRNRSLWNDLTPLLAQGDFKRAVSMTSKSAAATTSRRRWKRA
jgi:biopolymer transport protein ExbB